MSNTEILNRDIDLQEDDDIEMLDILVVLAKYKKVIGGVTLLAAVVSVAVSLLLPNEYEASTKLLPPQQTQSSAAALLSQLGGIAGAAAVSAAGIKNPNDMYVGMLKSRTVADHLIEKFNLKKAYGIESSAGARKKLEENTTISSGKDGLITISVLDKNQKMAAPLANAYVSELFQLMKTLAVTDAAQRRLFYERQLASTKDNLARAEMALKSTMDAHGVASVDVESRSILEMVGRLRAQISAKEIQLNAMSAFVTRNNNEYLRAQQELDSLKAELAKLENGRGAESSVGEKSGGLENIKLLRDLKYQQMIYEALAKQYEVARIDEAKDPSIIQVLDPAIEPERKAKPRRGIIVVLSTVFAFIAVTAGAFLVDLQRRKAPTSKSAERWEELRSHLRSRKAS